jgi:hypothetical protein
MVLQFGLNGTNVGVPIGINGGYLEDFTTVSGYEATQFEIGACAMGYQTFNGTLEDVSLVATVPPPVLGARTSGNHFSMTITGVPGWTYGIQSADGLAPPANWQTLDSLTLPSSPYGWVDPRPIGSQRFYRLVVLEP